MLGSSFLKTNCVKGFTVEFDSLKVRLVSDTPQLHLHSLFGVCFESNLVNQVGPFVCKEVKADKWAELLFNVDLELLKGASYFVDELGVNDLYRGNCSFIWDNVNVFSRAGELLMINELEILCKRVFVKIKLD